MADRHTSTGRHVRHDSPTKFKQLPQDVRTLSAKPPSGKSRTPASTAAAAGGGGAKHAHARPQAGRGGKQPHATRTRPRTGCYNPEVRKGIGAVLFALGIPTAVAGLVMTVVAATDDDRGGKYPPAFSAVGPVLLVCAFLLFFSGFSLISPIVPDLVEHCFSFDDPNSFCRVNCPRLSNFLKPDPAIIINRAAMNALKTEPGKSALKRQPAAGPPPPRDTADDSGIFTRIPSMDETSLEDSVGLKPSTQTHGGLNNGSVAVAQVSFVSETDKVESRRPAGSKGVRFSESDVDDMGGDSRRPRTVSASSDSSLLSLRNCKIHPKDNRSIWWTDDHIQEEWRPGDKEQTSTEL